jgi:hypothetical protein
MFTSFIAAVNHRSQIDKLDAFRRLLDGLRLIEAAALTPG